MINEFFEWCFRILGVDFNNFFFINFVIIHIFFVKFYSFFFHVFFCGMIFPFVEETSKKWYSYTDNTQFRDFRQTEQFFFTFFLKIELLRTFKNKTKRNGKKNSNFDLRKEKNVDEWKTFKKIKFVIFFKTKYSIKSFYIFFFVCVE